jgi:hypothetical protein
VSAAWCGQRFAQAGSDTCGAGGAVVVADPFWVDAEGASPSRSTLRDEADRWIRWTTTGCVALLALIAATVSYLHMHMLVELHGQPGWGGCAYSVLGGRDDRGCLHDSAGRLALWWPRRVPAVVAACCGQRGESCRQRGGRRADSDRTGDRSLALVRTDWVLRAADAPGAMQRHERSQVGAATTCGADWPQ